MSKRKAIATFGLRPHTVRVFSEDTASGRYCRATWRVKGRLTVRSWPDDPAGRKEAKAFGEQLAVDLRAPAAPAVLSIGALWQRYVDSEFDALRPKTQSNYRAHWFNWQTFAGRETTAQTVSRETLDSFRKALKTQGIAISQIRKHVELVKRVYRFGVDREVLLPTRLTEYRVKVGKDERTKEGEEYRQADALAILAALDPRRSMQWRAWAFCTIAHYAGARANAIAHLAWADVDLERGAIIWRAEWDKVGRERTQPVPRQVVDALYVALGWRLYDDYEGGWVFYTPRRDWKGDRPITYAGLNWMLRWAEGKAGVRHAHGNAMHRFRRGVVGDIVDATGGDVRLAMAYIGDDVRQATKYVKDRDDRLQSVADILSGPRPEERD